MARHGADGFLPRRFVRIGVPMLATALTLNLCQDWMLFAHEAGEAALPAYLASERFTAFWRAANWQSHLWFLHYLLAYSCLAWLWALVRRTRPRLHPSRAAAPDWAWIALLPLSAFIAPAAARLLPGGYEVWFGLASPFAFLCYLPFFAFGYALFRRDAWLNSFARFGWGSGTALAAFAAADAWLAQRSGAAWVEALRWYVEAAIAWSLCRALFAGFRTAIRRPSRALRYCSDAALSIYLFHHILVVGLAIVFTHTVLNIGVEFTAIVLLTAAVTLAIHHFAIMRSPILRFLFNGRPIRRAAPRQVAAA